MNAYSEKDLQGILVSAQFSLHEFFSFLLIKFIFRALCSCLFLDYIILVSRSILFAYLNIIRRPLFICLSEFSVSCDIFWVQQYIYIFLVLYSGKQSRR